MAAHFLLTTFGSFGDLHPYIAVGLGLKQRGHRVTIGSSEQYRAKVEGEGLDFRPLRPNFQFFGPCAQNTAEIMAKAFHPRTGTEYIIRELVIPYVDQSYEDTLAAAQDADVLVSHAIAFTTPAVAEKLKKPWLAVLLQPSPLLSIYDPPLISGAEWLYRPLQLLGPHAWAAFFRLGKKIMRPWGEPLNRLRSRVGLPRQRNVIFQSMFSPYGTQAWFSRVLAQPQRDWPRNVTVGGFPFYDKQEPGTSLPSELQAFLDSGPPPLVFTLGSSAVFTPGAFYRESLKAAQTLGCRAVLLVGPDERNRPVPPLPDSIHVAPYAPYSQLFPRASVTIHQGGVGTTAQALRSGRPMLVVPYSHDQPDNGMRVARLGAGRTIARHHYQADRVAAQLRPLLNNPAYAERAAEISQQMDGEDGVAAACSGLEAMLPQRP